RRRAGRCPPAPEARPALRSGLSIIPADMSSPRRPAPSAASPPGAAAGGEGGTATTGLEALRRVVAEQMVPPNQPDEIDLASLIRFSDDLPAHLDPATRAELESRAAALEPWLQGP